MEQHSSPNDALKEFAVGASTVGDEVFESVKEQESQEERLSEQYEHAHRDTHYQAKTQEDDREGFRSADDAHRQIPTTPNEEKLEKEIKQQEELIDLTNNAEDRTLARDVDIPAVSGEGEKSQST